MRMILATVALLTLTTFHVGCATPAKKQAPSPNDTPRMMKPLVHNRQERASLQAELDKDDLARTQVEGQLTR